MTASEMRPMELGEVLDRSFQTLRRHFGVLFATAVIGFLPLLVLYLVVGMPYAMVASSSSQTGMPSINPAFYYLMLASLLMMAVLWAALTAQVDAEVTGEVVAVGRGLGTGFRSLLRMIGAGILLYLAAFGLAIPVGLVVAAMVGVGTVLGSGVLSAVLIGVASVAAGGVALVIWLSLAFLAVPALVIEKLGPIKAMRRANNLAKGGRIRVCATSILAYLVMLLPAIGIPFVLGIGTMLWNPQAAGQMSTTQAYLYQAVMIVASAVTTPFMVATMVFTYYDRRVRREGYDVELASAAVGAVE